MHSSQTVTSRSYGTGLDGQELEIKFISLKSPNPGKKVYIQSGMHGGEVTIWVVKLLYDYLVQNIASGEVTFVPLANPMSWNQRAYFSTNGKFDFYMGKDWNRNFPGSKEGTLGERIAYELFDESVKYDFIIDLHTSRASFPFAIVGNESDLLWAKSSGIEYTYFLDFRTQEKLKKYMDSLLGQASHRGIPNITFECGSHDSYQRLYVGHIYTAILNILSSLNIINTEQTVSESHPKFYTKLRTYRALDGGFIKFAKAIGDSYSKGDVLYTLLNPSDLSNEIDVKAEEDGIIQKISPTHIYWPGDDVLECLLRDNIMPIS